MTTVPSGSTDGDVVGRSSAKPDVVLHASILLVAIVVLILSFSMTLVEPNLVFLPGFSNPLPESCTSRLYFGIDCPACGLTRGFISISSGRFSNAWRFNPASFVAYFFFVVQVPWQSFQIWRLYNGRKSYDKIWIYYLPLALAIALILQWVLRLSGI